MSALTLASVPPVDAEVADTLGRLWHEAERLGAIEVDHPVVREEIYRVCIAFTMASGSYIQAEGRDQHIVYALAAAINEARKLGAGGA